MKVNPLYVVALKEEVDTEFIDKFDVLITGVGKVNAAYELTRHLAENKNIYNLVINFGTAGSNYLDPGTFVDCTRFYEKDMDCLPLGFEPFQTPFEKEIIIDFNLESIFNPLNKNSVQYESSAVYSSSDNLSLFSNLFTNIFLKSLLL